MLGYFTARADHALLGGAQDSADNHPGTLSGLRSQSHDGGGEQHWLLDDTPGQLRTRLHTDLADSRLELGYLLQSGGGRSRGGLRGQGFELSSAGWGNVHAGAGLLLSTTARAQAGSTQFDSHEAVAQLKGAERSQDSLHNTLQAQQVPGLSERGALSALREAVDGHYSGSVGGQSASKPAAGQREGGEPVERLAEPLLLAESPEQLAWITPASALGYAGTTLSLTVQQELHMVAGQTIAMVVGEHAALFAQAGPLRAIAAAGPLSMQSHGGALELLADKSVTITASDDEIHITAQHMIVLQSGQSSLTLEHGNITFACNGEFKARSSEQALRGGESVVPFVAPLPDGTASVPHWIALDYRDVDTQQAMADTPYEIHFKGGTVLKGTLDADGRARHEPIPKQEVEKVLYEPRDPDKEQHWPALELIANPQKGDGNG